MNHNPFRITYTPAEEAAIAAAVRAATAYMARYTQRRHSHLAPAITDPGAYAGYSYTSPNGRIYIPVLHPQLP